MTILLENVILSIEKIRYTRIVTEEGDTWILQNGTSLSGCFCGIQDFYFIGNIGGKKIYGHSKNHE